METVGEFTSTSMDETTGINKERVFRYPSVTWTWLSSVLIEGMTLHISKQCTFYIYKPPYFKLYFFRNTQIHTNLKTRHIVNTPKL